MTIIGTFSKTADGYAGTIRTMTINVKAAFVTNDKNGNDKAPDFKLLIGEREFGAAWRAVAKSEGGKPFLRVEIDDPSFASPIRAALFENSEEGKGSLVWSRKG
jgi:uncharacterized protein (DUF736 family)